MSSATPAAAPSLLTSYNIILLTATLLTGTTASLAAKSAFQLKGQGASECDEHLFVKPYFVTFSMFVGELMCLPFYYVVIRPRIIAARQSVDSADALSALDAVDAPNTKPSAPKWFFAVLCTFDLAASTLNFVGLEFLTASINSMFRGGLIVFVAAFSILLLRRRLTLPQYGGLSVVVLGLTVVGLASSFGDGGSDNSVPFEWQLVGSGMVILSCALNGLQNTVEEKLSKVLVRYAEPHPMEIVGWEGVFGCCESIIMLIVVSFIPGDDCGGVEENLLDTLVFLGNSPGVLALLILFILALGSMNGLSMEVGRVLSAVYRNLVNAVRTISIWLAGVTIYYTIGSSLGEGLSWPTSLVQLAGFALLVIGSVLYSLNKEETVDEAAAANDLTYSSLVDQDIHKPTKAQRNQTNGTSRAIEKHVNADIDVHRTY